MPPMVFRLVPTIMIFFIYIQCISRIVRDALPRSATLRQQRSMRLTTEPTFVNYCGLC